MKRERIDSFWLTPYSEEEVEEYQKEKEIKRVKTNAEKRLQIMEDDFFDQAEDTIEFFKKKKIKEMNFINLSYRGEFEDYHLFQYDVDGKEHLTRVRAIGDKFEISVGFGDFRTKMNIEQASKMGQDIINQIKNF